MIVGAVLKSITAEPLVQFAAIGAALFVLMLLFREEPENPNLIRIDETVYSDLALIFTREKNRMPSQAEMDELVAAYVKNETLYREALALRLDHGDQMMRERLIQRMSLMMHNGVVVPAPEDEVLAAWYSEREDEFARPRTVSFHAIGLDGTQEDAIAAAAEANALEETGEVFSRPGAPLVRFENRPRDQIAALFEEDFVASVEAAPKNVWTPVNSYRGWQVVKLIGAEDGYAPPFEEVKLQVRDAWRADQKRVEAVSVLDALKKNYPVERGAYDPETVAAALEKQYRAIAGSNGVGPEVEDTPGEGGASSL